MTTGHYTDTRPRLHYVTAGDGPQPPLVLLHGLSDSLDSYLGLVPALARHRRVFALDWRGHGRSDRAARYRIADYTADLSLFLRQTVAAPAVVAGHSMGALVAVRATVAGAAVQGLLLEDPPLYRTDPAAFSETLFYAYFVQLRRALAAHRASGQGVEALARQMGDWTYGRGRSMRQALGQKGLLLRADQLDRLDEKTLDALIEGKSLEGPTAAELLPQLACPVHLVAGAVALGGALFRSEIDRFADQTPNASVATLEQAGHNIHHEHPRAYLDEIRSLLRRVTDGPMRSRLSLKLEPPQGFCRR